MNSPESGVISVSGRELSYRSDHYGQWSIPLSEIREISELTTAEGPFVDDYFFCFRTAQKEEVRASFYAVGWDDLWPILAETFPGLIRPGLCDSTSSRTRILWPQDTEEEPNQPAETRPTSRPVSA